MAGAKAAGWVVSCPQWARSWRRTRNNGPVNSVERFDAASPIPSGVGSFRASSPGHALSTDFHLREVGPAQTPKCLLHRPGVHRHTLQNLPGPVILGLGRTLTVRGCRTGRRAREEAGEVVMAGSGFWRYLHRRS